MTRLSSKWVKSNQEFPFIRPSGNRKWYSHNSGSFETIKIARVVVQIPSTKKWTTVPALSATRSRIHPQNFLAAPHHSCRAWLRTPSQKRWIHTQAVRVASNGFQICFLPFRDCSSTVWIIKIWQSMCFKLLKAQTRTQSIPVTIQKTRELMTGVARTTTLCHLIWWN